MNILLQMFIAGLVILVVAIIANFVANLLGLSTWYEVFNLLGKEGVKGLSKISFLNWIFLIIIYPFLLGLPAYIILK